jgi:trafficking protein particle complex subunit 11
MMVVDSSVVFWSPEIKPQESVVFQACISVPEYLDLSKLPVKALTLTLGDNSGSIFIDHDQKNEESDGAENDDIQYIEFGHLSIPGASGGRTRSQIHWKAGSTIVICGSIQSDSVRELKVHFLVDLLWIC